MRTPLWILNSIIALSLVLILIFVFYSSKKFDSGIKVEAIKPSEYPELAKEEKLKPKDIRYIYEGNDLFQTFEQIKPEIPKVLPIPELPKPPAPKPIISQTNPEVQFLEPLPIKITGIIAHSDESKSQVTLINNNTKESTSYKVGDKVFDAYILRIFAKKIILIRSNGQQETLYMYPEDAEKEINELKQTNWTDVVQQFEQNKFIVNVDNFVLRVQSLAQLIEMLDLSTAFKQGISIGCRIGKIEEKSIGYAFGFRPGDMIIDVANIAPIDTISRINIYNILKALKNNDTVKVSFARNGEKIEYTYLIKTSAAEESEEETNSIKFTNKNNEEQKIQRMEKLKNQLNKIEKNYNIEAQIQNAKKQDKDNMLNFGNESILDNPLI